MFAKIILSALLTCAGSLWIDKLYLNSDELTFPNEISSRSKFRKLIIFFALAILFNMTDDLFLIAAIFLLVLMTITDFEQYMLFDATTLPLALMGGFYSWQVNFFDGVTAAVIGGGIFLLLAIITGGAIGGGDVKLIFGLGFWLGAEKLLEVILMGTICGGVGALTLILLGEKNRDSCFAYGPYFTLSAIYILLAQ